MQPIDPRTPVLFNLAKETGYSGPYVELIQLISKAAEEASGKESGLADSLARASVLPESVILN